MFTSLAGDEVTVLPDDGSLQRNFEELPPLSFNVVTSMYTAIL